jgi:hypothetical protein
MSGHDDHHSDEQWGATVGKWTFILTVVLTALYVGAVIVYVR